MKRNLLATFATIAGLVLASQQVVQAQGTQSNTQYGGGYYTGTGQGYYGGYGQGYGSYGSGYSSENAPGYPTLSQQSYQPTRNDVLPDRSNNNPYNSYGTGRYGDVSNPLTQNPHYSGYGYGYGGTGLYNGTLFYGSMRERVDGFHGTGDRYFHRGSPYSRF